MIAQLGDDPVSRTGAPVVCLPGLLDRDVALVTGGAQGNGAAIGRGLARSGATVLLCDVDLARAEAVAASIKAEGGRAAAFRADVSIRGDCFAAAAALQDRFGPASILINNAGIFRRSQLDESDFLDVAAEQYRVNVEGSLNMAWMLRDQLRKTGGRILNVASIAAFIAYRPNVSGYAASKGAVVQMTKGLASDFAVDGVRVNAIAPGLFATAMTEASRSQPAVLDELYKHVLIKRFAEPDELVGAALFLTSRLSTYVTGTIVMIDGGYVAI